MYNTWLLDERQEEKVRINEILIFRPRCAPDPLPALMGVACNSAWA